jgi:hypothetical protein
VAWPSTLHALLLQQAHDLSQAFDLLRASDLPQALPRWFRASDLSRDHVHSGVLTRPFGLPDQPL